MSLRPSTDRPRRPHPSDGRPGGGVSRERKRAPRSKLERVRRFFATCFTGAQSRRSGAASPGNPRMYYRQVPQKQQVSGPPEMTLNPLEPIYQYEEPHRRAQGRYLTNPEAIPGAEIIIALMGVTGAGKSYFIKEVSGNSEVVVGSDLYSCTHEVQSYSFEYQGAKITLVDTPGFDDTNRSDTEVLREIADWASATYGEKRLLSGIIYLHPITHSRVEGSSLKNLRMFQSLCGQKFPKNVFLTTTQWSSIDPAEGEVRENSLRSGDFWGGLIDKGATLQRFLGTKESGLELIRGLMPSERKPLDIEVQIVSHHVALLETDAGKCINEELIAQEKKHKEEIEFLKGCVGNGKWGERDPFGGERVSLEEA